MDTTKDNTDRFIHIALSELNSNSKNKLDFFETPLTNKGKELDEIINTFSFLYDKDYKPIETKPFQTIHEIRAVFNNSQLLSPSQLSKMMLNKNMYIETPEPGDWVQFTINNIEHGLFNIKNKNNHDSEKTISYLTKITEKIPRK